MKRDALTLRAMGGRDHAALLRPRWLDSRESDPKRNDRLPAV